MLYAWRWSVSNLKPEIMNSLTTLIWTRCFIFFPQWFCCLFSCCVLLKLAQMAWLPQLRFSHFVSKSVPHWAVGDLIYRFKCRRYFSRRWFLHGAICVSFNGCLWLLPLAHGPCHTPPGPTTSAGPSSSSPPLQPLFLLFVVEQGPHMTATGRRSTCLTGCQRKPHLLRTLINRIESTLMHKQG